MRNKYRPGDHKMICDRTGFVIYASQSQKEWNGLRVRSQSFEARHPQDFVKGVRDDMAVKDARPEPPWRFLADNEVAPDSL